MIESTIAIYVPIQSKATDGTTIKKWGYNATECLGAGTWSDSLTWTDTLYWNDGPDDTIVADLQPKGLTEAQVQLFGLSNKAADAKVVYDFNISPYCVINNRALYDSEKQVYLLQGVNNWPSHNEILLTPVQGVYIS